MSLDALRAAGRIAAEARREGESLIVAGATVREVCEAVERAIVREGGGLAFPVQSSRNAIAAHYCPSPEDPTTYEDGDLAKLDVGVHVDGWVVDTAVTVNVGDRPQNRALVDAARAALEAAIALATAGRAVRALSAAIDAAIRERGYKSVRNLCGHGVGRWTVHGPPPIPNVPDASADVIGEGPRHRHRAVRHRRRGPRDRARHGRGLPPGGQRRRRTGADAAVLDAIRDFRGLPFARRQLAGHRPRPRRAARCGRSARRAASPPIRRWWTRTGAASRRRSTRCTSVRMARRC